MTDKLHTFQRDVRFESQNESDKDHFRPKLAALSSLITACSVFSSISSFIRRSAAEKIRLWQSAARGFSLDYVTEENSPCISRKVGEQDALQVRWVFRQFVYSLKA